MLDLNFQFFWEKIWFLFDFFFNGEYSDFWLWSDFFDGSVTFSNLNFGHAVVFIGSFVATFLFVFLCCKLFISFIKYLIQ